MSWALVLLCLSIVELAVASEPERGEHVGAFLTEMAGPAIMQAASEGETFHYSEAKGFKALAACLEWQAYPKDPVNVPAWGESWETQSQARANEIALNNCRKYATGKHSCTCELSFEGDNNRVHPPANAVAAFSKTLSEWARPTLCRNWFSKGDFELPTYDLEKSLCDGYVADEIGRLSFPLEELPQLSGVDTPLIFIGAPVVKSRDIEARGLKHSFSEKPELAEIRFSDPRGNGDFQTAWTPTQGWGYLYRLHRIPRDFSSDFRKRLDELDTGRMLRRSDIRPLFGGTAPVGLRLDAKLSQFVRSYDLTDPETRSAFSDSLTLPEESEALMRGERSRRIWVLSAVPVDADWIPLGAPLREVVPLAFETNRDLYVFSVEMESYFRYRNSAGGNTLVEHHGVIDFSRCKERKVCSDRVTTAFRAQLVKSFIAPPLSATLVNNPQPPYQFQLQRLYQPSEVLKGFYGPWFEIATYTISVWPGPDTGSGSEFTPANPGETSNYFSENKYVFLHVDMGLQLGISKGGKYPEPSADQYSAYQAAVQKAVDRAVGATMLELNGTMQAGVGIVSNIHPE